MLLIIIDASDENALEQYKSVCEVLDEIHATKNPRLICLNKIDKTEDDKEAFIALRHQFPDALCISAKEEIGFVDLKDKIYEILYGEIENYLIPISQTVLINEMRKAGCIQSEEWLEDGVHITARTTGRLAALSAPFMIASKD